MICWKRGNLLWSLSSFRELFAFSSFEVPRLNHETRRFGSLRNFTIVAMVSSLSRFWQNCTVPEKLIAVVAIVCVQPSLWCWCTSPHNSTAPLDAVRLVSCTPPRQNLPAQTLSRFYSFHVLKMDLLGCRYRCGKPGFAEIVIASCWTELVIWWYSVAHRMQPTCLLTFSTDTLQQIISELQEVSSLCLCIMCASHRGVRAHS